MYDQSTCWSSTLALTTLEDIAPKAPKKSVRQAWFINWPCTSIASRHCQACWVHGWENSAPIEPKKHPSNMTSRCSLDQHCAGLSAILWSEKSRRKSKQHEVKGSNAKQQRTTETKACKATVGNNKPREATRQLEATASNGKQKANT